MNRALAALALVMLADAARAYDTNAAYPSEVALSQEGDKGYVFRRFPGSQRLYTYDKDTAKRSVCNIGCDGAHNPVRAPAGATPMGEWTIIDREDGTRQWVFRGHPLYTAFHDAPGDAQGEYDGFRLVPFEK